MKIDIEMDDMMTNEEMLENAAKAVGRQGVFHEYNSDYSYSCGIAPKGAHLRYWWNPLENSGEALEVAVDLGLRVYIYNGGGDDYTIAASDELTGEGIFIKENHNGDNLAATRLAIVRAAAMIGKLK